MIFDYKIYYEFIVYKKFIQSTLLISLINLNIDANEEPKRRKQKKKSQIQTNLLKIVVGKDSQKNLKQAKE